MANWDFILAYDERAAGWLDEQGYARPDVVPGNRLPTTGDLKWAIANLGLHLREYHRVSLPDEPPHLVELNVCVGDRWVAVKSFDWENDQFMPDEAFSIRGDGKLEFDLLIKLCERCGKLWMYPDDGSPATVLDKSLTYESTVAAANEADTAEDSWMEYHRLLYKQ